MTSSPATPIRIVEVNAEPSIEVRFLNAGRSASSFYTDILPVHEGTVEWLPDGIEALIATADLQGRERFQDRQRDEPLRLLGEVLPERLETELLPQLNAPAADRIGVLLAGDFYTVPAIDRRGGSGDVTSVWEAFADRFAFVAGVAGNHDTFGESLTPPRWLGDLQHVHYLDGETITIGANADSHPFTVAGLGGIIGNPKRPHRRWEEDYLLELLALLDRQPSILVLHDGPDAALAGCRGSSTVRELIEDHNSSPLIVRGHAHWPEPFVELDDGTQVLNVDCRAVVLTVAAKGDG